MGEVRLVSCLFPSVFFLVLLAVSSLFSSSVDVKFVAFLLHSVMSAM